MYEQNLRDLTWETCLELEPRLGPLMEQAKAHQGTRLRNHQASLSLEFWYDVMKPGLSQLVGWGRRPRDPILSSSNAYDIVYDTLLEAC